MRSLDDWIYWSILAAAVLHVAEEYSTGFLCWFRRAIPSLAPGMTPRWAFLINVLFLLLCLGGALAEGTPNALRLVVPGLLLVNATLHVLMTVRMREYSPGLATACALYLPLAGLAYDRAIRDNPTGATAVALSLVGAVLGHSIAPLSLWVVIRKRESKGK